MNPLICLVTSSKCRQIQQGVGVGAVLLLVALCLYDTLSSPLPRKDNSGIKADSALR